MADYETMRLARKFIEDGYNRLEVISIEFGISMNELIRIQRQVEEEKKAAEQRAKYMQMQAAIAKQRQQADSRPRHVDKLGVLRKNYERIFNGIAPKKAEVKPKVAIPDNEVVRETIEKVEALILEKKEDNIQAINLILDELKVIKDKPMSVEQAEQLLDILYCGQILNNETNKNLKVPMGNQHRTLIKNVNYYRKNVLDKFIEALKAKCDATNNLEELKNLSSKLRGKVSGIDYVAVTVVRGRIQTKLEQINKELTAQSMYMVSDDMDIMLRAISSGEVDDESFSNAIESELQERTKRQKKYFVTTREKQIEQIFYALVKALENHAEEYPITNPEKTLEILEQKFGMGFDNNFRAVIHNLIERKSFVEANALCDKYTNLMGKDEKCAGCISSIRNDIRRAEIGQIVLRAIHTNATVDEQNRFFDFLDGKMQRIRFSYDLIPLGKTKDGKRKITLKDIMENERFQDR